MNGSSCNAFLIFPSHILAALESCRRIIKSFGKLRGELYCISDVYERFRKSEQCERSDRSNDAGRQTGDNEIRRRNSAESINSSHLRIQQSEAQPTITEKKNRRVRGDGFNDQFFVSLCNGNNGSGSLSGITRLEDHYAASGVVMRL